MDWLTELYPRVFNGVAAFCGRYGLAARQVGDAAVYLESPVVRIELILDRRRRKLDRVHIYAGGAGPFLLWYIEILRNNFMAPPSPFPPSLSSDEKVLAGISSALQDLVTYCGDLLTGDASALVKRDKYDEFKQMMTLAHERYFDGLLAEPVPVNDSKGDFRYVKAFWDAELKKGTP
jgi:hypothetical protein